MQEREWDLLAVEKILKIKENSEFITALMIRLPRYFSSVVRSGLEFSTCSTHVETERNINLSVEQKAYKAIDLNTSNR